MENPGIMGVVKAGKSLLLRVGYATIALIEH